MRPLSAVRSFFRAPSGRAALPLADGAILSSRHLRHLPVWRGLVLGAMAMVPAMATSMSSQSTIAPAATSMSQTISAPPPPLDGCGAPLPVRQVPSEGIILPPAHAAQPPEAATPCPTAALQASGNPLFPPEPGLADPLAKGMRHVRDALLRVEKAVAKEHDVHTEKGKIGDYEASFALGRSKLDAHQGIDPQVDADRPNLKSHLGVAFDTRLGTAELKHSSTLDNGFTSTHGVNATVRAHYDLNVEHLLASHGNTLTQKRAFTLDTREEAYQSWSRELSDSETVNISVYGGYYSDLLHPSPQLYIEASQTLQHDVPQTTRIFGGTTISGSAREGVKSTIRIRDPFPYYEVSGTVSKTWPVSLLGSQGLTVSSGIQLQRDQWTPLTIQPEVNATLKW